MKHYGDVNKINGAEVEPVDIITFGSPCQDLSVAGKRAGIQDGERSNLFFEAIRIIKEMREATNDEYPKYAVWENVPGAFSSNKGHDFHAVLEAFCSVCDGAVSIPKPYDKKRTDKLVWNKAGEIVGDNYSIAWRTLDAQYWGVPQRRKRIYLVADFTGRRAGEILFKPESLRGNITQSNETEEGATTDVVGGVDRSVGVECVETVTLASSAKNAEIAYNISPCLMARAGTGGNQLPLTVYAVGSVDGGVGAAGVVSKGNGDCFIMPERHMSLSVGGGQAGQGYPCVIHGAVGVECVGFDMYNQASTGDKTRTLKTPAGGDDLPVVCVLNDQGGSSMNVESEEISPTLRANSHQHEPVIAFTQNQREEVRDLGNKAGALAAEAGVHQQTYVAQPVIALQANGIDRADTAGCNGCGWRENESYTLNTVDRHAVCFEPGAMVRDMGNRVWEEQSPTLRANMGDNQPAVCFDGVIPINTMTCQGRPSDNGRMGLGVGELDDPVNTISAAHCHAVCYGIDQQGGKGGANYSENMMPPMCSDSHGTPHAVCFENHQHGGYREGCGTLRASGGYYGGGSENVVCYDARGNGDSAKQYLFENHSQDTRYKGPLDVSPIVSATFGMGGNNQPFVIQEEEPPRRYIIRRLTPTECARLQGFPDWWSTLAPYDPADADFWEDVRKTHAEINGKKYKPVKDIKKWYNKLHTDSAEYRMWGNGLALPNAEYVLRGIAEQGAKTLGSLFDGSGGFPLAGVLNGIKPIWASEVEPYPIAVTKSRFKATQEELEKVSV